MKCDRCGKEIVLKYADIDRRIRHICAVTIKSVGTELEEGSGGRFYYRDGCTRRFCEECSDKFGELFDEFMKKTE